jgi:hypothetical protein
MASFVQLLAFHDTHSSFTELLQLLLAQFSYNTCTSGMGNEPCVPVAPQYYLAPNVMLGFQMQLALERQYGNPYLRICILQIHF